MTDASRLQASDPAAAEAAFRELLVAHPTETAVIVSLARCLHAQGRTGEALDAMRQAIAIAPKASLFNDLGVLELAAENRAAAIDAYRRAIELEPAYALALFNLADVLADSGCATEAIDVYRRGLAAEPNSVEGHVGLAVALVRMGDAAAAVAECGAALAWSPDNVPALHAMAVAQAKLGNISAAILWERRAVALRPQFAKGWHALGNFLDDAGQLEEAASAYRQALAIDAALVEAEYDLASLTGSDAPPSMPRSYTERLFDDFAPTFERRLVEELEYQVPAALRELVDANLPSPGRKLEILDLGCGTGLVGKQFRDIAARMTGVDVSTAMLAEANAAGVYDELVCEDVVTHMSRNESRFDLILAADLFIYIGDLDPLFAAAARALKPGGWMAFSIETIEGRPFELRRTRRYAHSLSYITELTARHGLTTVASRPVAVRRGEGGTVAGHVILLACPEPTTFQSRS